MRPKKKILLVDANEERASIKAFVLNTSGYAVMSATSAEQAMTAAIEHQLDLVIALSDFPGLDPLLMRLRAFSMAPHMVHIAKPKDRASVIADWYLSAEAGVEDLLERCKLMCARKRGPRSHSKPPVADFTGKERDEAQRRIA